VGAAVQPFIDEASLAAKLFPPKALATVVPIYSGIALLCLVAFNVAWSLISAHPFFQGSKNEEWLKKQR
jgi:hypothetical protein